MLDDEAWQVKSLLKSIEWARYGTQVVGTQTNSLMAYDEIIEKKPHIVFTDVKMPVMDGLELIHNLQKDGFQGVFVVISGHAEYTYAQKALSYNAVEYCLKPIENEEIIAAIKKAIIRYENKRLLADLKIDVSSQSDHKILNDIIAYVNQHFDETLSLQSVADVFYINNSYLSKLFKSEMQMTFTVYLSKLRLERACILLRESSMQIAEVAEKVGFLNYFYFARVFKKEYGMTPSEYKHGN